MRYQLALGRPGQGQAPCPVTIGLPYVVHEGSPNQEALELAMLTYHYHLSKERTVINLAQNLDQVS